MIVIITNLNFTDGSACETIIEARFCNALTPPRLKPALPEGTKTPHTPIGRLNGCVALPLSCLATSPASFALHTAHKNTQDRRI
jgi:hypothetical protein